MAKRKMAARKTTGKAKAAPRTAASRKAKKRPAGKAAAAKAAKKASRKAPAKKAARKAAPRKAARPAAKKGGRGPARKAAAKAPARKAAGKARVARPAAPVLKKPARAVAPLAGKAAGKARGNPGPTGAARPKRSARTAPIRGAIPSSLGMNGGSSAARSGREELLQHIKEHTETGPAITAGDVDADWQLAYSSGDEAPGGDNPTPDQDVVDEIGEALGINYEDGEELKGAAKIEARDKHRWELDPASKEDLDEE
jgi:hypothetical protein